jgi:hypothetical protein
VTLFFSWFANGQQIALGENAYGVLYPWKLFQPAGGLSTGFWKVLLRLGRQKWCPEAESNH